MTTEPLASAPAHHQVESASHGATGARIADNLRDAILAGEYLPGERIRPDELAERNGASRIPVRDALRILESEGLVTVVVNTGAWVAQLSAEQCQEMYLIRERVEPLLLRLTVPLLDDDTIDGLEFLATSMQSSNDVERFLRLDREFHMSCVDLAPTTVLGDLVLGLWNRTQHYRRAVTRLFYQDDDPSVHLDHLLIVNALRLRDADEAEHVLARHIRRSRLQLARHPEVFTGL